MFEGSTDWSIPVLVYIYLEICISATRIDPIKSCWVWWVDGCGWVGVGTALCVPVCVSVCIHKQAFCLYFCLYELFPTK